MRLVDILCQKEYSYTYEEGRITRAVESDVVLNENQMIVSKTIVHTLRYIYDQEGNLLRKHSVTADGTQQISYSENDANDCTMVKIQCGDHEITSHSKTDSFGRKEFDEIQTGYGSISRQFQYHVGQKTDEHFDNGKVKSTPTTNLVSQITFADGRTLKYEYDAEERITKVIDSLDGTTVYTYDALGQLLTETVCGARVNTMTYDNYGNILTKNGVSYTYGDSVWKDKLTAVGAETISYDAQGNPISYLGHTLTWEKGRQLKSFDGNTYTYNANGIRTSKTVNGVKHTYTLDGTKILRETWGNNVLVPLYDNEDSVCGILYNGTPYYFERNLQGDVTGIYTGSGANMVLYTYDAWGACTIVSDSSDCGIGNINPFRYRGYYYDAEIDMYYLQSRYYNPNVGRFINIDDPTCSSDYGFVLNNSLFSYCNNTPVNGIDSTGYAYAPVAGLNISFYCGFAMKDKELKKYSISAKSKIVTVISCSPSGWVKSSKTMGLNMALSMKTFGTCSIECPINTQQFQLSWKYAGKCVIIHTHGSAYGLYNDANGITPMIIPVNSIQRMRVNRNIKFVMVTACSTAAGDPEDNVAYWLSKRINRRGIVIANKYTVVGESTHFEATGSRRGWVAYKNGRIVKRENQMPVKLTMRKAYKIYQEYTDCMQ